MQASVQRWRRGGRDSNNRLARIAAGNSCVKNSNGRMKRRVSLKISRLAVSAKLKADQRGDHITLARWGTLRGNLVHLTSRWELSDVSERGEKSCRGTWRWEKRVYLSRHISLGLSKEKDPAKPAFPFQIYLARSGGVRTECIIPTPGWSSI